ncbi:MAG: hypothetical protein ABG776_09410, partial [Cyanobacteria bacterium J06555_13]
PQLTRCGIAQFFISVENNLFYNAHSFNAYLNLSELGMDLHAAKPANGNGIIKRIIALTTRSVF